MLLKTTPLLSYLTKPGLPPSPWLVWREKLESSQYEVKYIVYCSLRVAQNTNPRYMAMAILYTNSKLLFNILKGYLSSRRWGGGGYLGFLTFLTVKSTDYVGDYVNNHQLAPVMVLETTTN